MSRPLGYKTFSCSTQLSKKFQFLIKLKYREIKKFLALNLSDPVFILLINVKVPTIVGILTFMSRPLGYKTFSCSTQLSKKFQFLIKLKYREIKKFLALNLSDPVFILLINVKVPTIVGILTFMSRINFVLS